MDVDSWESTERNALWALEHAAELSPRDPVTGMAPLLRLWEYCSQGAYTSWTILTSTGTEERGRPKVREVVWKRRHDEKHVAAINRKHMLRTKPKSTIHVRDAEISFKDLNPFLEGAARLFVPEAPFEDSVSQEDLRGIEGYRSMAYLRMEWRGSGPREWAETIRWVTQLQALMVTSLKDREEVDG